MAQWERLAREVKRRREQLRLRQRDVELRGGPGPWTVRNIEQVKRAGYSRRTYTSLERALEWPEGTISKILEGTATEEELRTRVVHGSTATAQQSMPHPDGDTPLGDDRSPFSGIPVERLREMRFGPGERIPRRDATIVTVAELLARLRAEKERTPSMDAAEAALLRLLPELYGRDYPAIAEATGAGLAAELERLRCQLTAAQAAIQRVRQLCAMKPNLIGPDLYAEDVLAALDGDTTEERCPINTSRPNASGRMTLHESLELIRERYGDAIRQLGEQ